MVDGPSRSAACGIFRDQGLNPCPLHWQADSQPLRHQGSPRIFIFHLFLSLQISNNSALPPSQLITLLENKSDQKRSSSSFPHQISNLPAPFLPIDSASLPTEMNVFSVPLCEVNPSTCVLDPFFSFTLCQSD